MALAERTGRVDPPSRWLPFIVLGIVLLWASDVCACKPFIQGPSTLTAVVSLDPAIRVTSGTLSLDCHQVGDRAMSMGELRCQLRSTQRLRNNSDTPARTVGIVTLTRGLRFDSGLDVERGGTSIARPPSTPQLEQWREHMGLEEYESSSPELLQAAAFDLALSPGEETEVEIVAEIITTRSIDGCALPGINTRHRLLSPDDTTSVLVVRGLPEATAVPYEASVEIPRGWYLAERGVVSRALAERSQGAGHGRRRYRRAFDAPTQFKVIVHRAIRFVRGGPFIAAGIDLGDGVRPRLRAGWEVASPWPLWVHALAVETDLRSLTVVPSTEVVSANIWLVVPSFGLGIGAPLRVVPRPRAGIRTQLTINWPFVGLVGTLDILPVAGTRPDLRGGLMLQVGL